MKWSYFVTVLLVFAAVVSGWAEENAFSLTSPAFATGATIPSKYSRAGGNVSPPLDLQNIPSGALSFALIMYDPDAPAGNWVHWILANIPATEIHFPEGTTPAGVEVGHNSWNQTGYDGPQPPSRVHRYIIQVYALDVKLVLPAGFNRKQLEQTMRGHILGEAAYIGTYP